MNVEFIERLRAAAAEHGVVADLVLALDMCLSIDDVGNKAFVGDEEDYDLLKDVFVAAQFIAHDRKGDHG